MRKLRLLLTLNCPRSCPGCCNNGYDTDLIPVCVSYLSWDEIILTGGEPMLNPKKVLSVIEEIRESNPTAKIYMYTATYDIPDLGWVLYFLDGVTITLHNQDDVEKFQRLNEYLGDWDRKNRSIRLNVFKGVDCGIINPTNLTIKKDVEWLDECHLPVNETLMKEALCHN